MKRIPLVFIVDDDERMCLSLQSILQSLGYQVAYATSGESALKSIDNENIDVFLSDIYMPGLNGFDLMERIVSNSPCTPVILMTGDATVNTAIKALKKGAYGYLKKPFVPEELLRTIDNAWQHKLLLERTRILCNRLNRSERRFRFLLQNTPDMIYTLDPAGRFKFVNDTIAKKFGYRSADLVGKKYESILWDDDISNARWRFNERRTGERATSGLTLRLKPGPRSIKTPAKRYFSIIELHATGVYCTDKTNGKAAHIGTYGVIRDTLNKKCRYDHLNQIQRYENDINTELGEVGYDLNNSLWSTRYITSSLKQKMDTDNPYLHQIKVIENYIKKSQYQVRHLLWLAGGKDVNFKRENVKRLNHRVTFRLKAPKASQVMLAGDFNQWDCRLNPLIKGSDGFWKTTLVLSPGRYEFKFVVDGIWRETRENEIAAPNRYGTLNNLLVVGDKSHRSTEYITAA